ncbi:MAG: hypothetical protein HYR76_07020 [Ignavibacteria bacterium]|nr:hypothetical protein [Ignavibacteria bacterium]
MKYICGGLSTLLILGLNCTVHAQLTSASAVATLTITVAGAGIAVNNVDCDVTDVIRGVCYQVVFDATGGASIIYPSDNGEATTDLGADILGDPGQNVLVSFTMPTALTGTAGVIPISFGSTSGVRIEDGALFNPNIPNIFNTGTGAAIGLRLGFSFCAPVTALAGDTYVTTILCTASYTGAP